MRLGSAGHSGSMMIILLQSIGGEGKALPLPHVDSPNPLRGPGTGARASKTGKSKRQCLGVAGLASFSVEIRVFGCSGLEGDRERQRSAQQDSK